MKNNWIVLAGGPNSGKTTTLEAIKKLGYAVETEQATKIIHEYIEQGIALDTLHTDKKAGAKFQEAIAERQIYTEQLHSPDELVFFDRGAFDYLVFSKQRELPLNDEIVKAVKSRIYGHVFFLGLIDSDFAGTKIEAHLDDLHKVAVEQERIMLETIESLNLPYTKVPVMPLEERVDFILKELSKYIAID